MTKWTGKWGIWRSSSVYADFEVWPQPAHFFGRAAPNVLRFKTRHQPEHSPMPNSPACPYCDAKASRRKHFRPDWRFFFCCGLMLMSYLTLAGVCAGR